jgi:glycerol-3-phosphate acyltransferase PlsY
MNKKLYLKGVVKMSAKLGLIMVLRTADKKFAIYQLCLDICTPQFPDVVEPYTAAEYTAVVYSCSIFGHDHNHNFISKCSDSSQQNHI